MLPSLELPARQILDFWGSVYFISTAVPYSTRLLSPAPLNPCYFVPQWLYTHLTLTKTCPPKVDANEAGEMQTHTR